MGPKRHRNAVIPHAEDVLSRLYDAYGLIELCGSFRRGSEWVGDVDVVVSKKLDARPLREILGEKYVSSDGVFTGIRKRFDVVGTGRSNPICVDVWEVESDRFGAAILHATGNARFNITLQRWARHVGLRLTLFGVLALDGSTVASQTEEECFSALGLPFFEPEERHASYESLERYVVEMNGCYRCAASDATASHVVGLAP